MKSTFKRIAYLPAVFLALWLCLAGYAASAGVAFDGAEPVAIIDVRTQAEYAAGHIRGATNIPVDRIGEDIGSVQGIDKDSPILLYCRTGSRSERARQILMRQGYSRIINGGSFSDVAKKLPACHYPQC